MPLYIKDEGSYLPLLCLDQPVYHAIVQTDEGSEWRSIVATPRIQDTLRRMAQEARSAEYEEGGFGGDNT